MSSASKHILGLDLGTTSIGYALLKTNEEETAVEPLRIGVYRFEDPYVEGDSPKKSNTTKNRERSDARRSRRLAKRKKARRRRVLGLLRNAGLADQGPEPFPRRAAQEKRSRFWPYDIWLRAYDENLEPYEFGRILYLLAQRRGFKSNLGAGMGHLLDRPILRSYVEELERREAEAAVERQRKREEATAARGTTASPRAAPDPANEDGVLAQVGRWRAVLRDQPLGRFFYSMVSGSDSDTAMRDLGISGPNLPLHQRAASRNQARNKANNPLWARPDRASYEREFERLWARQAPHLGLGERLKEELHEALFFQNPLRFPADNRAYCSRAKVVFEDGTIGRRHLAPRCSLLFQEYRLRKLLADLKVREDPGDEYRHLSLTEKERVFQELNTSRELSWTKLKSLLGLAKRGEIEAQIRRMKGADYSKEGIRGNPIAAWFGSLDLSDEASGELSKLWATPERFLQPELKKEWKGQKHVQDRARHHLIRLIGEAPFARYSRDGSALPHASTERVVVRLQEDFQISDVAAFRLATAPFPSGFGSLSYDAMASLLPYLRKGDMEWQAMAKAYPETEALSAEPARRIDYAPDPRLILSPRVRKALNRVRRVVHALLDAHPQVVLDEIRVEFARRMQVGNDRYAAELAHQAYNRRISEDAEEKWHEWCPGRKMPRGFTEKYKLWMEADRHSPYGGPGGRPISCQELVADDVLEIDHVWPRHIGGNGFGNKLLVFKEENQQKRDRGPWDMGEAWRQIVAQNIRGWKMLTGKAKDAATPGAKASVLPSSLAIDSASRKMQRVLKAVAPEQDEIGFAERQAVETGYIAKEARDYLAPIARRVQPIKATFSTSIARNWGFYRQLSAVHGDVDLGGSVDQKKRVLLRHHAVDALATALCSPRVIHAVVAFERQLGEQGGDGKDREKWLRDRLKALRPAMGDRQLVDLLSEVIVVDEPRHEPRGKLFKEQPLGLGSKQIANEGGIQRLNKWLAVERLSAKQVFGGMDRAFADSDEDEKLRAGRIRSEITRRRIADYLLAQGIDGSNEKRMRDHIVSLPDGIPYLARKGTRYIRKVQLAFPRDVEGNYYIRESDGGKSYYPKLERHCAIIVGEGRSASMQSFALADVADLINLDRETYRRELLAKASVASHRPPTDFVEGVIVHKGDLLRVRPKGGEWSQALFRVESIQPSAKRLLLREHWSGDTSVRKGKGVGFLFATISGHSFMVLPPHVLGLEP